MTFYLFTTVIITGGRAKGYVVPEVNYLVPIPDENGLLGRYCAGLIGIMF